jgi:hypothetical protein
MAGPKRNVNRPKIAQSSRNPPESDRFWLQMSTASGAYQIHTEARGPHWIAWISRDGSGKPERSVILVGETKDKAEANAKRWAEQSSY